MNVGDENNFFSECWISVILFLWPNERGDGFVTNNSFDLAGLLKVICRFIFSTCVEIDLTQWVKSVSAGAEVGFLRE